MGFDLGNFFSTLIGAGVGAWGAYCFNLKQAEKQQKETEKAKLLKLFYDINILIKIFVYHYENTVAEMRYITNAEVQSFVPLTINDTNFDITEYGFIAQYLPLLYEILTYVHQDINYINEQQNIANNYLTNNVSVSIYDAYFDKIKHIKVSTVKLLAKLFVTLININGALVKYYKCNNLIKNEVINAYIRAKKIIDETIKEYSTVLKDTSLNKKYIVEDMKTIKADLGYLNEILTLWIIDLGLNSKQKTDIETEIEEQAKKKWEAPENDL